MSRFLQTAPGRGPTAAGRPATKPRIPVSGSILNIPWPVLANFLASGSYIMVILRSEQDRNPDGRASVRDRPRPTRTTRKLTKLQDMNNRTILTGLLGAGTVASATAQAPAKTKAQTPQGRPNIVIIYTDDMGIGDLSCTSTGWIETPSIDRLASQGLVLNSYYSSAPVSSPSRVGLTTGMFPMEWGINTYLQSRKGNAACEQADYLAADAPSMARILRDAGYATGHFGKWHMGGGRDVKDAPSIPSFGFDEYCSTWESPDPAPELTATNWIWSDKDDVKRWNRTGYFVDKTLDFLVRHKDKPCFVNLWPDDMHTPWVPDEESQHKQKDWNSQPNFSEVLAEYDRQIGRFLTQLDQLGLSDNTIVIFTSDNGPAPSFRQLRTNGMRGVKNSLYEGGIRMPFIIRWPGVIEAGKVDDTTVVCAVDLLPSLCKIARARLPKGYRSSGEDMSRALLGKPSVRKGDLMWDFGRNEAFMFPRDRYHRSPSLAIRRGNWKLLLNPDGSNAQLYDIAADINETKNLAEKNPALVRDLSKTVLAWWERRPRIGAGKQ